MNKLMITNKRYQNKLIQAVIDNNKVKLLVIEDGEHKLSDSIIVDGMELIPISAEHVINNNIVKIYIS